MAKSAHHIQIGKAGESIAQKHLAELGLTILACNWRYQRCEVDIIATQKDIVHFIEVKTRSNQKYGLPETAVTETKMNCLKNAAEAWQIAHPEWKKIQFDVIAIQLQLQELKEIHINWDVYF